ncbi:MAG TPA: FAD/NAD(P)-binding protein, partial [Candidatus Binataceae bacterium]|nr:FAD/NAD(P)-binding protein [Candidatus Binataceae bacterium]
MTAIQLLRNATSPLKIVIIEPRANLGGGIAYSTEVAGHLLNVPAGQMSAFADEPDHFLRWLRKNSDRNYGPQSFASRSLYGDYLADTLYDCEGEASRLASIDHYRTRATRVEVQDETVRITLRNDIAIVADRLVLALGHQASANRLEQYGVPTVPAWSKNALANLDPQASVLLVGTGLTAVDTALALDEQGHRGPIYAISRHGKWPQV